MATFAIIAEYNPFHSGHEYHIRKIREQFGKDTAIVIIMSGNFTQRGEVAFADKLTRARCALSCGANLVVELPFPYSMASADIFAKSAIHIANSLGFVDYLSFGSESGDITLLEKVASVIDSQVFTEAFKKLSSDRSLGYAKAMELAYLECKGSADDFTFTSNNILAIEYIKSLKKSNSDIKPHTVKRCGAEYSSEVIDVGKTHQSASAIRKEFYESAENAFSYLPDESRTILEEGLLNGELPCDGERLSSAIISHYRLSSVAAKTSIHDAGNGLYNRLISASYKASNISSLLALTETKKFTRARIRRAIWYGFLGVTSSDVKTAPRFTQILAMDSIGISRLKTVRKTDSFSILTKPADYKHFDNVALCQKKLSERADSVFELTRPKPKEGNNALKLTPFVKK